MHRSNNMAYSIADSAREQHPWNFEVECFGRF